MEKEPLIVYQKVNVIVATCRNCGNSSKGKVYSQRLLAKPKNFITSSQNVNGLVCAKCYKWTKTVRTIRGFRAAMKASASNSIPEHVDVVYTGTSVVPVELKVNLEDTISSLIYAAMTNTSRKAYRPVGGAIVRLSWAVSEGTKPTRIDQTINIVEDI